MRRGKILIVEDELIARENLDHVLKKEGYDTVAVESGVLAFKELEKQEFENNENIKDDLSAAAKEAQKLAAQIKEMKEKILTKNTLSWEDKKQLEQIQQKHEELTKEMQEIKDKE